MRSAESYAQEALDKRGYVVIARRLELAIGAIVSLHGTDRHIVPRSDAPVVVIAETDAED